MPAPAPPPVKPTSVISASPGPFTTQPMIDSDIGVLMCASRFSSDLHRPDHVEPLPRAGRAGDDVHPAVPQPQRLQDLEADLHLLDRIGRQAHPDGVADPHPEQAAEPDRRLHRAGASARPPR